MTKDNYDCELRRLKLIEACAYYVLLKGITVDQLEMNDDLASLITERLHAANLDWSIGGKTRYSKLLDDAMQETLPDVKSDSVSKSMVHRFNFRSLVEKEVCAKRLLFGKESKCKIVPDTNGNEVCYIPNATEFKQPSKQSSKPSAAPHDFLLGFSVHIKPDAHLDDNIPICARDQHLLYNIFGNEWKSSTIIDAYIAVKGQTGFMHKWSHTNGTDKVPYSSN